MSPLWTSVSAVAQIILVNIVLSGDNALVIALTARHLPPKQRRVAMLWGSGLAIVLRLVLTLVVSYLLLIPGLRLVGGLLLAWIACKLVVEEGEIAVEQTPTALTLRKAVARIALADLIMSLDNVVAIAGVSRSDPTQLIIGLVLSIATILIFSNVVVAVMNRLRWVAYVGTAVLAYTAAGMLAYDLDVFSSGVHREAGPVLWSIRIVLVLICVTAGRWWPVRGEKANPAWTEAISENRLCPVGIEVGAAGH